MRTLLHLSTHIIIWAVALPFTFAFTTVADADVIHVPADFPSIQEAINAAQDGDEIVVAPGTYFENINLLGKAIHLRSSDGPEKTIIDGQDLATVITCDTGEGPSTVIEGFSVRSAIDQWPPLAGGMRNINSSPTIVNCHFGSTAVSSAGLAVHNEGGGPAFFDCSFIDIGHYDCDGCGGIRNVNANVFISGCTFANIGTNDGGAIRSTGSSVVVADSTFTGNFGHSLSGTIRHTGGTLDIIGSTFTGNDAGFGDAAAIEAGGPAGSSAVATIVNSTFESNIGGHFAGAVIGAQTILNSTFIGNKGWGEAGAVLIGDGLIDGCTFIGNDGGHASGAVFTSGSPTILNSTFAGNMAPPDASPWNPAAGAIVVDGNGNPAVGGSTFCANAPGHIIGQWTTLGGNQFGPHCPVGDLTGNGKIGVADLLMLLAQWGACDDCTPGDSIACPADLDGDCAVGVADLLIFLANWG